MHPLTVSLKGKIPRETCYWTYTEVAELMQLYMVAWCVGIKKKKKDLHQNGTLQLDNFYLVVQCIHQGTILVY